MKLVSQIIYVLSNHVFFMLTFILRFANLSSILARTPVIVIIAFEFYRVFLSLVAKICHPYFR